MFQQDEGRDPIMTDDRPAVNHPQAGVAEWGGLLGRPVVNIPNKSFPLAI